MNNLSPQSLHSYENYYDATKTTALWASGDAEIYNWPAAEGDELVSS